MRILGVDPGYDRLGIAVLLKERGKQEELLFSACIETSRDHAFSERLRALGQEFKSVLDTWHPDILALEELYMGKNQKTVLQVAEARGTILYLAAEKGLSIETYSPQAVKIATTGYGKSDKAQVTAMLPRLITLPDKKRRDDEYDAIAVALTCAAIVKIPAQR